MSKTWTHFCSTFWFVLDTTLDVMARILYHHEHVHRLSYEQLLERGDKGVNIPVHQQPLNNDGDDSDDSDSDSDIYNTRGPVPRV